MKNSEWKKQTISLNELEWLARQWLGKPTSIIAWMVELEVLPVQKYSRANMIINTNLNPDAISLGYLAEAAVEWDREGESYPNDFVGMLKFETAGTVEKQASTEVLNELSSEATA